MSLKLQTNDRLINGDISRAHTLPSELYRDQEVFAQMKEKIFARSWQLVADLDKLAVPGQAMPHTMLEGYLNEPILITRDDEDNLHCLSNVCTHRGSLLVESECHAKSFRCRYHGRRFGLNGCILSTPGFDNVPDFPSSADNLSKVPSAVWGKFMFASINPAFSFDELIGDMRKRTEWMPFKKFIFDPARAQNYITKANWALYVDNYLEGFHVPYVHPSLAAALDTKDYITELYPYSNLQLGVASNPADAFNLPEFSPDADKHIAAYYYWVFPNMMFNFYPWGLSVNIVTPLAPDRTRITFLPYVFDESKIEDGAGANLDRTEREDESIVELVQKGVQSRFYKRGRYSPVWEQGPHHFHSLLSKFLAD